MPEDLDREEILDVYFDFSKAFDKVAHQRLDESKSLWDYGLKY